MPFTNASDSSMPFTLAHPIAVLPLWHISQRRLDLPALIVGATIPDIAYFIALYPVASIGHSPLGLLQEGIPSALTLLFIGRYLLWDAVLALLPTEQTPHHQLSSGEHPQEKTPLAIGNLARRIPPAKSYSFWPLSRLLTIIFSVIIGALTHIIWDSATHFNGWTVVRVSWLSAMVGPMPLYKWLQHGGGVMGLALLGWIIVRALQQGSPQYHPLQLPERKKTIAWLSVAAVTGLITWKAMSSPPATEGSIELIIGTIIGLVSGSFVGLCLYAIAFWSGRILFSQKQ